MANSKYEYVRNFEQDTTLLPNTWIVVRVDGRGFHKLSNHYSFTKPNDRNALELMNRAARHVLHVLPDVVLGYGVSDEFSFVFHRSSVLFERRREKIVSTVVSTFTAAYVLFWNEVMGCTADGQEQAADNTWRKPLEPSFVPTFDGRAVCYPAVANLRDYLCWRQVDCHINNLYNTTFWALVQKGGMSNTEAEEFLKGTVAADKNEILWARFGINYNNEEEIYRKGSVVFREYALEATKSTNNVEDGATSAVNAEQQVSKTQAEKMKKMRQKAQIVTRHVDIIKDEFWNQRPWILSGTPGRLTEDDKHA